MSEKDVVHIWGVENHVRYQYGLPWVDRWSKSMAVHIFNSDHDCMSFDGRVGYRPIPNHNQLSAVTIKFKEVSNGD